MYRALKELSCARKRRCASTAVMLLMLSALTIWTGCGDIFRPTANPIPGPSPDPANYHVAIVISQNAAGNPGSGMQIDVSGDSDAGVVSTGQQPLFAALQPQSNRVFVSNSDGTITSFSPAGFGGSIGTPITISVPAGLVPGFLSSTETGTMYAATSGATNPPVCASSAVLAINVTSQTVENIICVGANPTVLTETPDHRKVYSVNSDGTVSSINTVDKTVNPPISCSACPQPSQPLWAVAGVDGSEVFVLDASGAVWIINTLTDQVSLPSQSASSSNFMALEKTHNRLYVTSPSNGSTPATLSILDASAPTLNPVTAAPLSLPAGTTPVMVSFLPDGTAAYVLSVNNSNSPVISVVDTSSNRISGTIDLPSATANPAAASVCQSARFPFSMAASGNSARVYVANCYAGSTSIIDTSTNRRLVTMNSPTSAYPPVAGATYPPPQNPVFVVAGP